MERDAWCGREAGCALHTSPLPLCSTSDRRGTRCTGARRGCWCGREAVSCSSCAARPWRLAVAAADGRLCRQQHRPPRTRKKWRSRSLPSRLTASASAAAAGSRRRWGLGVARPVGKVAQGSTPTLGWRAERVARKCDDGGCIRMYAVAALPAPACPPALPCLPLYAPRLQPSSRPPHCRLCSARPPRLTACARPCARAHACALARRPPPCFVALPHQFMFCSAWPTALAARMPTGMASTAVGCSVTSTCTPTRKRGRSSMSLQGRT